MNSAVASLNDATPEKGEHLWVSGPAVLTLARLYVFQPWDLHGVQGINVGSCPAAQKCGDLRWDQLQALPLGNPSSQNLGLDTWAKREDSALSPEELHCAVGRAQHSYTFSRVRAELPQSSSRAAPRTSLS